MLVSGCEIPPRGSPTHTDAASCGVNPVNHAAANDSVVPVLPAAGRPIDADAPVRDGSGPSITPRRTLVTVSAVAVDMTRWQASACFWRTAPSAPVTDTTAYGAQNIPRAATVA